MSAANSLTRAFICIDFPDQVIKEIARIQALLSNKKFIGKLTELENLHLTLKFLGEIPQETIEKVKLSLSKVKFSAFEAYLEYAGVFSRFDNPKIIWIKIGSKSLLQLQSLVDSSLISLGFQKEERFMSHLTIARIKYIKDKNDFINYIKHLSVQRINFSVSSFKLKSSELKPLGPIYTTLEEYPLQSTLK